MDNGFEGYVRARGDTLRRFAYLLCGDRHLGEDLVQEVLIKANRRWSKIEAEHVELHFHPERKAVIGERRTERQGGCEYQQRSGGRDDGRARQRFRRAAGPA